MIDSAICRKGTKVYFGRKNGEQTLGEITKVNSKSCKVKQLEQRGTLKDHKIGTVWTVPFALMIAAPADAKGGDIPPAPTPEPKEPLKFNMFDDKNPLYLALLGVLNGLSPENISCDGEAPRSHIARRSAELNRQKRGIEIALGGEVSETELYAWDDERRKYEAEQKKMTAQADAFPATTLDMDKEKAVRRLDTALTLMRRLVDGIDMGDEFAMVNGPAARDIQHFLGIVGVAPATEVK